MVSVLLNALVLEKHAFFFFLISVIAAPMFSVLTSRRDTLLLRFYLTHFTYFTKNHLSELHRLHIASKECKQVFFKIYFPRMGGKSAEHQKLYIYLGAHSSYNSILPTPFCRDLFNQICHVLHGFVQS